MDLAVACPGTLEIGASNALMAITLKDAQETAAENKIAPDTVAARDIPENVNASMDGLDLIALMKTEIFAPAKMIAEEHHEDFA